MPEFTLTISNPKTGKSYNKKVDTDIFKGKKINDTISGDFISLKGYELKITGGSDKSGFPMRSDLPGTQRRKILTTKGIGVHIKKKGMRKRKNVAGNQVSLSTAQVNLSILKSGPEDIDAMFGAPKSESKE